jgi:hypothetical protein
MFVAAPGLFSMTTGWLKRSDNHRPMMRTTVSAALPGGYPTIQRTDWVGYQVRMQIVKTRGPQPQRQQAARTGDVEVSSQSPLSKLRYL